MIKAKIVILGVLHIFHNSVPNYSLKDLELSLNKIKPDLIAVELMQSEIDKLKSQSFKIEYNVILPYAKKNKIPIYGLDPEEPKFSKMADPYIKNQKDFPVKFPAESKVQGNFQRHLFDYLIKEHWTSASRVQSEVTDSFFDLKHRFQEDLMGKAEKDGWNDFNSYYSSQIFSLAEKNKGKTILVTIGVEHVYWLKKKLSSSKDFEIVNTEQLLNVH